MTAHLQTLCEWIWVNPWLFFSESLVEIQHDPPASAVLCQCVTGGTEQTRQKHSALISIFTWQAIVCSTLTDSDFGVKLDKILFNPSNATRYGQGHTLGHRMVTVWNRNAILHVFELLWYPKYSVYIIHYRYNTMFSCFVIIIIFGDQSINIATWKMTSVLGRKKTLHTSLSGFIGLVNMVCQYDHTNMMKETWYAMR